MCVCCKNFKCSIQNRKAKFLLTIPPQLQFLSQRLTAKRAWEKQTTFPDLLCENTNSFTACYYC